MALFIPPEIAREIVNYTYQSSRQVKVRPEYNPEQWTSLWIELQPLLDDQYDRSLLRLRGISRTFQTAVDEVLFRSFEINSISYKTLARVEGFLSSPFILSAIREYTFAPYIHTIRPVVRRNEAGYRNEYFWAAGVDPKRSTLMEIHRRRTLGAKLYDEQIEIVSGYRQKSGWFQTTFKRLLRRPEIDPAFSRLRESPYLGRSGSLVNLTCIRVVYRRFCGYCDDDRSIYYLVRDEISAGIGALLAGPLPQLNRLVIDDPTLTDLEKIVRSVSKSEKQQNTSSSRSIKRLEMTISTEEIYSRGRDICHWDLIHAHLDGGRAISDFLGFFPELEILYLQYGGPYHLLLLHDFHSPVLPKLQSIKLRSFGMTFSALWKLTLGNEDTAKVKLRTGEFRDVLLIKDGSGTWDKILTAWANECLQLSRIEPSEHPRFCIEGEAVNHLGYLDSICCAEETLTFKNQIAQRVIIRGTKEDLDIYNRYFGNENEDD